MRVGTGIAREARHDVHRLCASDIPARGLLSSPCWLGPPWRKPSPRRRFSPKRSDGTSCRRSPSACRQAPLDGGARAAGNAGQYGGEIVTLVPRAARHPLHLRPTPTRASSAMTRPRTEARSPRERRRSMDDRIFTFTLREGHRWSDGAPFTTEDFRYYWEDIANNRSCRPPAPPEFMIVERQAARSSRCSTSGTCATPGTSPIPRFLPPLARPRRPGHLSAGALSQAVPRRSIADKGEARRAAAKAQKLKSWAALHNRLDDMKEQTNPDLPILTAVARRHPRRRRTASSSSAIPISTASTRRGSSCPISTASSWTCRASGLFAAKANAGEVDLLVRGLSMNDIPVLKEGEKAQGYTHAAVAVCARLGLRALSRT